MCENVVSDKGLTMIIITKFVYKSKSARICHSNNKKRKIDFFSKVGAVISALRRILFPIHSLIKMKIPLSPPRLLLLFPCRHLLFFFDFWYIQSLQSPFIHLKLPYFCTVCFTDLDQGSEMIIFESIVTTFIMSFFF